MDGNLGVEFGGRVGSVKIRGFCLALSLLICIQDVFVHYIEKSTT